MEVLRTTARLGHSTLRAGTQQRTILLHRNKEHRTDVGGKRRSWKWFAPLVSAWRNSVIVSSSWWNKHNSTVVEGPLCLHSTSARRRSRVFFPFFGCPLWYRLCFCATRQTYRTCGRKSSLSRGVKLMGSAGSALSCLQDGSMISSALLRVGRE